MYRNDGDNGMYGGVFVWVTVIFVTCCCNKGGSSCNARLLFLEVNQAGLLNMFRPIVLEPLAIYNVTEIVMSCLWYAFI